MPTIDPAATTDTLLPALAGGAIGAVLTGLAWTIVRLGSVPGDLRANELAARVLNEDVELWVADIYRALEIEFRRIKNSQGPHVEGSTLNKKAAAKTAALHRWRDRLHQAEREFVALQNREHWYHRLWRALPRYQTRLVLTAPDAVQPVIERFRDDVGSPDGTTSSVRDPTHFTLEDLIGEIEKAGPLR